MAEGFGPLVLNPKQEREAKLLRKSVLKHFQHLEDPRADRGRNHSLVSRRCPSHFGGLSGCRRVCRHRSLRKSQTILVENLFGITQWDTFPRHLGSSLRNARTRAIKVGIPRVDRGNHRKIEPRTNPHRGENRQGFL
jgi:hypothetical protein